MSTINEKVRSAFEASVRTSSVTLRSGFDINLSTSDVHSLCDMFADEDKWVQFFESTPEACYAVKAKSLKLPDLSVSTAPLQEWLCPFYVLEADVENATTYFALMRDVDRKNWKQIVSLATKDRIYEEFDILYWFSQLFERILRDKLYRDESIKGAIVQFADAFKQLVYHFARKGFTSLSSDNFIYLDELAKSLKDDLRRLMWRLCFKAKQLEKEVLAYEKSLNITV